MLQLLLLVYVLLVVLIQATPHKPPHLPLCNRHPIFKLSNITYSSDITYSTPAHLAVAWATVGFNLTNTAVPYTTQCTATASGGGGIFFYGGIVYQCTPPTGPGVGKGAGTNFTYNESDGTFNVNSTWNCWNERKHQSQKLLGFGTGSVKLACESQSWTNPNWQMGQIYHTEHTSCKPGKLRITPTVINGPK